MINISLIIISVWSACVSRCSFPDPEKKTNCFSIKLFGENVSEIHFLRFFVLGPVDKSVKLSRNVLIRKKIHFVHDWANFALFEKMNKVDIALPFIFGNPKSIII